MIRLGTLGCSQDGTNTCGYDNAAMEAFWSTLKREAAEDSDQWSKDRVRRELFQYIEATYNRSRLHSSLGYQSPVDFESNNS